MYQKGAEPITRRSHMGVEFRRMLDGIPCPSEDVHIDFERNEKKSQLQIHWHGVKPSKPYPVASFDQMSDWIKEGRARVNDLEGPMGGRFLQPAGIKKITVTGISLNYTASSYFLFAGRAFRSAHDPNVSVCLASSRCRTQSGRS